MKRSSQAKKILKHLETVGPITPLQALELFGCFRLAARIYDLKEKGYDVKDRPVTNPHGVCFKEYYLEA